MSRGNKFSTGRSNVSRVSRSGNNRQRKVSRTMVNARKRKLAKQLVYRPIPSAYASRVRPRFNMRSKDSSGVRVEGCDLVYTPEIKIANSSGIFCMIPANPAYWRGTRVATIASTYMSYRPIFMRVHYIPDVATSVSGSVAMGTLWDSPLPSENLNSSLVTSNGGVLTTAYNKTSTTIALGTNLTRNLYNMQGALSQDSNPFMIVAASSLGAIVPGSLYLEYTYEFKNPVGAGSQFGISSINTFGASGPSEKSNQSLLIYSPGAGDAPLPGSIIDVEKIENRYRYFYKGSEVDIATSAIVQFLWNDVSLN